ncbi:YdeI/OmpD-associated family protein [Autumnicola psychrophila]|uniref:YdeI/OmpD-associated family protein n=1 Tax=Autumnicola psychrophila TaxID=3075592 RepID=A0ABU3DTS3_9FLAO|nr:YdeI/OmpD-associated family protein [Zunongwangia sp. F225]MDT0687111.1 YdeI/OmpD-associated family protein [Zunongwangia sp. F225]
MLKYVAEATANQKLGAIVKPEISKQLILPPELKDLFKKDEELKKDFAKLPDCKQREYGEYIIEAKKESTKQRRLEKIIPLIKKGVGLNDHYRKT